MRILKNRKLFVMSIFTRPQWGLRLWAQVHFIGATHYLK